ncbi:MAG: cellulose synthase [Streptosporangiaceae bacterium]|jgi:hypothetical protein
MSTYNAIAWLPLCAGLTGLGLVASWFAYRRRGLGSGLRGVAWSLLPLAIYLTGSIEMFWKIGTAIGDFAASFVLSPKVWSGVAVAALAAVLFVVSGPAKRARRRRTAAEADATPPVAGAEPGTAGQPGQQKAAGARRARKSLEPAPARAAKSGPADDDMREVEEILRRRGIN